MVRRRNLRGRLSVARVARRVRITLARTHAIDRRCLQPLNPARRPLLMSGCWASCDAGQPWRWWLTECADRMLRSGHDWTVGQSTSLTASCVHHCGPVSSEWSVCLLAKTSVFRPSTLHQDCWAWELIGVLLKFTSEDKKLPMWLYETFSALQNRCSNVSCYLLIG